MFKSKLLLLSVMVLSLFLCGRVWADVSPIDLHGTVLYQGQPYQGSIYFWVAYDVGSQHYIDLWAGTFTDVDGKYDTVIDEPTLATNLIVFLSDPYGTSPGLSLPASWQGQSFELDFSN